MARRWRASGMTLVELLVVIAIIGVMVALLLPAVQYAREAVRRASCQNNLHQIGIALHNYHGCHRSLPPGCLQWRPWNGPATRKNFAWSALLLPFLEQANLNQAIDYHVAFDHPRNASVAAMRLSAYTCPSVPDRPSARGRSDYAGIFGQRITIQSRTDNGLFIHERSIRFSDIADGLTQTMAVAEDAFGQDAEWINGNNILEQSGGINDPKSWIGDDEIRGRHGGGAMVLFGCGRAEFLSDSIDPVVLAAMITRDFSETIGQP
jgi:prepilin-type N-terminal cleavage/methylation domain-containing protein